jgi:hypothetical protein
MGDWSENIKSGEIRPPKPPPTPEETPPQLHGLARKWGYMPPKKAEPAERQPSAVDAD